MTVALLQKLQQLDVSLSFGFRLPKVIERFVHLLNGAEQALPFSLGPRRSPVAIFALGHVGAHLKAQNVAPQSLLEQS
ncbi:MAG: hypothetical protein ACFB12_18870 [Leptolyngbyaceae cyanobacterium]